jgi:hypothetical protein
MSSKINGHARAIPMSTINSEVVYVRMGPMVPPSSVPLKYWIDQRLNLSAFDQNIPG